MTWLNNREKEPTQKAIMFCVSILVCLGVAMVYFYLSKYFNDHFARKVIDEGSNKGFLGAHELSVDETGVLEKTEFNESLGYWKGIEKLVETEDHVFIFIAANQAHIIPKARISDGDLATFLIDAKKFYRLGNPEAVIV